MPNRDIKWKYFSLNATVFWLISDKQNFPNVPFHSLLNVAAIKQSDKQCSTEAAYETVRHCEAVQAWKRFEKLLAKQKNYTTQSVLKVVYNAIIHPYLNYSILIWGHALNATIHPLIKLQNKAIKIIKQTNNNNNNNSCIYKAPKSDMSL